VLPTARRGSGAAEQAVLLTYADRSVRERHAIVRGAELQGLHARAHDGGAVGADRLIQRRWLRVLLGCCPMRRRLDKSEGRCFDRVRLVARRAARE